MDKQTIRLFKSVVIENKKDDPQTENTIVKDITKKTIKRGFVFDQSIITTCGKDKLIKLIKIIEEEVGLTAKKMNNAFHKSWGKVITASDEQLFLEQIIHYMTTYGFQALGIYNEDSIYIPPEKLKIPKLKELS